MAATRIGITANISKPNAREVLTQLRSNLLRCELEVLIEKESAQLLEDPSLSEDLGLSELAAVVDLLIVLGGDGSILRVVGKTIGIEVPIMGINIGTLGFLTCGTQHAIDQVGEWIQRDHYKVSNRALLEATVTL